MAATIPIGNLYYLLAYAWNHNLAEADLTPVDSDSCPDLNNLFALILANATHGLVRRGLDRSYVPVEEETPRIRGRIDFSASEKSLSRTRGSFASTTNSARTSCTTRSSRLPSVSFGTISGSNRPFGRS